MIIAFLTIKKGNMNSYLSNNQGIYRLCELMWQNQKSDNLKRLISYTTNL